MERIVETLDLTWDDRPAFDTAHGKPIPGLLLVVLAGQPVHSAAPLPSGGLELGRGVSFGGLPLEDATISRRHARISQHEGTWCIQDLGSRNGSALDGERLEGGYSGPQPRLIRLGNTLIVPLGDVRPHLGDAGVREEGGTVLGGTLRRTWQQIARAALGGDSLHIQGESGAGKELAARAFHQTGPQRQGPFVAVNCAAIPLGLAERLLFGAVRGAFSGADANADGYLQAADGGTLFLDELAELDPAVQAKLLRVVETHEVLALGAARPRAVRVRLCSATHRELRAEVAAGRLREDLYFRIGQPSVVIPPLRERLEEIPYLVRRGVDSAAPQLTAHASLHEACLLRHWPGNVRELISANRAAAHAALAAGDECVEATHLSPDAGQCFRPEGDSHPLSSTGPASTSDEPRDALSADRITSTLAQTGGNVSQAARLLGLHRTQLRRLIDRHGLR